MYTFQKKCKKLLANNGKLGKEESFHFEFKIPCVCVLLLLEVATAAERYVVSLLFHGRMLPKCHCAPCRGISSQHQLAKDFN